MGKKKVMILSSVHAYDDPRVFHKEAVSLAQAGYEVELHAVAEFEQKEEQGVKIVGVKRLSRWKRLYNGWVLYKRALASGADIFHFHDPELLPWGVCIQRRTGKPVIYDSHEDLPQQIHTKPWIPRWMRPLVSSIVKVIEKGLAKRLAAVITVKDDFNVKFTSKGAKEVVTVKNYPLFTPLTEQQEDKSVNRILYVGGVSYLRGYREMIEMMEYIPEEYQAELHIIGPLQHIKQEDQNQEALKEKNIFIHGRVSFEQVKEWYKKGKVGLTCLHPIDNYRESLPIKLFEYMSMGLPQVATNFPQWQEILESNQCGYVVDPLKPEQIAEKVVEILKDPEHFQLMSRQARKTYEEKYNWQMEEKHLFALYQRLLQDDSRKEHTR
ncbi:Glycosyltransferase involved in cell wall bisynthesis [Seinonella peptonophila]|uniref:Glycosyltransferase involved in cell wall bisynthesis n=1 Tax=Seinonella peptonophila TaxID=112248 RepID=A0A1M4XRW9_9BACL|nr:glycosyltransferase family 4 protein [Seinonella peptonophila]SHE96239.1 Glycosyltransferase involved in cell wall bisynthesis [Seinonella peptonophila]